MRIGLSGASCPSQIRHGPGWRGLLVRRAAARRLPRVTEQYRPNPEDQVMLASPKAIRAGAAKPNPFTICIIANPALEAPWQSGIFIADPIIAKPQAVFDAAAAYIEAALF